VTLYNTSLKRESRYFYRLLFRREITHRVEALYCDAHEFVCHGQAEKGQSSVMQVDIDRILDYQLDAEAIELALRPRRSNLQQKLHLLVYLAEQSPDTYDTFVLSRNSKLLGMTLLTFSLVRSAYKLCKGYYLLARYRLV